MKNLLLIPLSYPYEIGKESTFLENEISYYTSAFLSSTILPSICSGNKTNINETITIDCALSAYNKQKIKPHLLLANFFYKPSLLLKELIWLIKNKPNIKNFIKAIKEYLLIISYIKFFEQYNIPKNPIIIYTYWFTPITTAACLFAKNKKNTQVVSRAHGIDLFEERNKNYIPYRQMTINLLKKIIVVSENGKNYLINNYHIEQSKISVNPIGINDLNITAKKSNTGNFNIVSCSSIDENKRLHLIIEALNQFAQSHKNIKITWNHFGDGILKDEILRLYQTTLKDKVQVIFHGQVSNIEIINFYKLNPVDVFITTSASEGGRPVSINEAICCSIPIIGTSIGGIPELVNESNGILLKEYPSAIEISNALYRFLPDNSDLESLKENSRKTWQAKCDATKTFPEFINLLQTL